MVSGFRPGQWRFSSLSNATDYDGGTGLGRPLTYNVIRSCIDTVVAKLCLSRPMPRYLPSAASEELTDQVTKIERYVWGVLMANDAWATAAHAFRDAALYGDGYLHVRAEDGRILIESVHPDNILVDDNAAINGNTRSLFKRDWWDRDALLALFPEQTKEILIAPRELDVSDDSVCRDLVKVIEAWHLPCGNDRGRHLVVVESATLIDEEWDCPRFPIVPVRWSRDLVGWHGTGLAEELQAIQLEINETLGKISGNIEHLAVPYVACPKGADVNEQHLMTNLPYRLITFNGPQPPQIVCPPAVNEQVFAYLETLYKRAFEIAGVSMLSATSQKPSGLYSGVALINYIDVETQRFSQEQRTWEQITAVELAKRIVDCAQRTTGLRGVNVVDDKNNVVERIEADDLDWDMDDDLVEVQVYPASSLPKTLPGRVQMAVEMAQSGAFDRTQIQAVLGDMHPDIDKHARLNNAPWQDLCMVFEHMLSTGEYVTPIEFQDLSLGVKLATHYWCRARVNGLDEDRYGLLEAWMSEATAMLQAGQQPPMPPAAPPPAQATTMKAMPAMPAPIETMPVGPDGGALPPEMMEQ
jgi:hypothetical protein